MNADFFKMMSETVLIKYFLIKPYGVELMFLLDERANDDGIDDTHRKICSTNVQKSMLSNFLYQLETHGAVIISQSKIKKSKRIPELSPEARKELISVKRRCGV